MNTTSIQPVACAPARLGGEGGAGSARAGRGERRRGHGPRAFTLVELLVVISIILVLMSMVGAAVGAARGKQRKMATAAVITSLSAIIQQQYSSYASRSVAGAASPDDRVTALRRLISGDLPDNWADVRTMKSNPGQFTSGPQRAYVAVCDALNPTDSYADAECLFMIVMQGGVADCVTCGDLKGAKRGDADADGALEFWDSWGNPIRFVLWPAAFELPPGTRFFSTTLPFAASIPAPAPGGVMRPLIFSAGPDGKGATAVNAGGSLGTAGIPTDLGGFGPDDEDGSSGVDRRPDNITNFDVEISR